MVQHFWFYLTKYDYLKAMQIWWSIEHMPPYNDKLRPKDVSLYTWVIKTLNGYGYEWDGSEWQHTHTRGEKESL